MGGRLRSSYGIMMQMFLEYIIPTLSILSICFFSFYEVKVIMGVPYKVERLGRNVEVENPLTEIPPSSFFLFIFFFPLIFSHLAFDGENLLKNKNLFKKEH